MKILKRLVKFLLPYYGEYLLFSKAKLQSNYFEFLKFKSGILKRNFPAHKNCVIAHHNNIHVGINCLIGRPGNYLQGKGGIYFGNYVQLAQNVGILTSNHDLYDQRYYNIKEVRIGDYCWVGMNSVILPGVVLGTRTIVAAGSVVTKSFPEGFCVIGGSPAKIIKELDPNRFIPWKDEVEYYGFVSKNE